MPEPTQQERISQEARRNPKTDSEILAALQYDVTSSEPILSPIHRSWYEAILWTAGEQGLEWNPRTHRFQPQTKPLNVPRAISNLMLSRVERAVAMFLKSMPTVRYAPTSAEARDRQTAENATGAIAWKDRVGRMEAKKRDLANWVVTAGTGFAMVIEDKANAQRMTIPVTTMTMVPMMDPGTGEPMLDPATGDPMTEEKEVEVPGLDGKPDTQDVILYDEGVEMCAPFEIVPDWNARYPWEWRRYTHVRSRGRDWLVRVFGSKAKDAIQADAPASFIGTMGSYQTRILDVLTRAAASGAYGLPAVAGSLTDMRAMEDSGVVLSRYELPNDDHPEGRLMIATGRTVLYDGSYPYGERLNLFTFRWHVLPGSPSFGFGMPRNVMNLQKRRNGIDTQVDLIRKTMGNPRILADRKSQVSLDTQTTEMGHVITYKSTPGVDRPSILPPASADADARFQRAEINADADDVAGTMDVLRGINPAGVTAGVTIAHLTEQAAERFRPAVEENREEFLRMYDLRVEVARNSNLWARPRPVKMVGINGRIGHKQMSAADITGEFSAEAEDASAATMSHALKYARVMELVDKGAIDLSSEKNRDRLRQMAGAADFSEDVDLDRKRAEDENERMYRGEPVPTTKVEDLMTHADVHTAEMKTDRFMEQPAEIQDLFYRHVAETVGRMPQPVQAAGPMPAGGEAPPNGPQAEPMPAAPIEPSGTTELGVTR